MIYCYECCGEVWEAQHLVADRHKEKCPKCKGEAQLIIQAPEVAVYDHYVNGVMVDDHSQDPKEAVVFYNKRDHTEWLKRNNLKSPAYN